LLVTCARCLGAETRRCGFVLRGVTFFPAHKHQGSRSEAAQMRMIANGKAQPEARDRSGLKRLLEAEKDDDEVVLFDEVGPLQPPERYAFVDGDSDGELATPAKQVPADARETPPTRKKKTPKTGENRKNRDLQVVDPHAEVLEAAGGTCVKINLAKLILRPVTKEEIDEEKHFDGKQKLIDDECWRCLLPRYQAAAHPEFVRIGQNTGNLMRHCKQYHEPVLEALKRVIAETPKEQAKIACQEYIENLPPPPGSNSLVRMLGLDSKESSNELLCLIWFLDANISFAQFDNPLFQQLIRSSRAPGAVSVCG
jgi:hypothetical protein